MALWQRWSRNKRNKGAVFPDDAATTTMLSTLRQVGAQHGLGGTNDVERATVTVQMAASQRIDSASRGKVRRAMNKVENAQRRHRHANARVDRFEHGARRKALKAYEEEEAKRAKAKASKEIDNTTPQVPPLVVGGAEIVLLVAEFAFYYTVFGRDLQADASMLDRIFIVFLAIFVPVVGIMSARFFAGCVQHLRAPQEHGTDHRNARIAYLVAASVLLAITCYTTLRLVNWRYKADAAANYGTNNQPPGAVMATVFVALILTDALIRAFLYSPGERTSIRRRWQAHLNRRLDDWLLWREIRTLAAWQKKWFAAQTLIAKLKNDTDGELASATVAILLTRGELGGDESKLLKLPQSAAESHVYVPHDHLAETDGYVALPHRILDAGHVRLHKLTPPEDPVQEQKSPTEDLLQDDSESTSGTSDPVVDWQSPSAPHESAPTAPTAPNGSSSSTTDDNSVRIP